MNAQAELTTVRQQQHAPILLAPSPVHATSATQATGSLALTSTSAPAEHMTVLAVVSPLAPTQPAVSRALASQAIRAVALPALTSMSAPAGHTTVRPRPLAPIRLARSPVPVISATRAMGLLALI